MLNRVHHRRPHNPYRKGSTLKPRRLRRRHLIVYLPVHDLEGKVTLGHVADITPAGLLLIGRHPLAVGRRYKCRLVLPRSSVVARSIDVDAVALWTKPDVNPIHYATGCRLLDLDPRVALKIDALIAEFGFAD